MKDKPVHKNSGLKLVFAEGWLSIAVNILLFGLKYWAGLVTGSVAILADAWHTLSDSLSSIFVLLAAKVSSRPPDKKHPFGHGRADLIAAVMIAVLLGFIAFDFIVDSVKKLISGEAVVFGTLAVVVTVLSVLLKEGLAQFAFWAARKTQSATLRADGWHHRTDALSSLLILAGIFLAQFFWWIDSALGLLVSVMILYAAYGILKDSFSRLLGEAPHPELRKEIIRSAARVTDIDLNIHHIHLHSYGNHKELTFHILLPGEMRVDEAHQLAEKIEHQINEDLGMVATIHVDPVGAKIID